jgi:tetratricopeptide (TPR) repeat protein
LIRQVQNQNSESEALMSLSLLACQLDDFQEALKLSGQALLLAEQSADRNLDAYTLTGQGRALAGMGQLGEAVGFYQESLAIRRELKQWHLAAEIEALLAQLHFNQDDLVQASAYVERVMAFLQLTDQQDEGERPFLHPDISHNNLHLIRPLNGTQEPFQVYLTCYQVLAANGDERSNIILDYAVSRLHEEAEQLKNPDLQRALLENVPANRKLLSIIEGRNVIEHLAGYG